MAGTRWSSLFLCAAAACLGVLLCQSQAAEGRNRHTSMISRPLDLARKTAGKAKSEHQCFWYGECGRKTRFPHAKSDGPNSYQESNHSSLASVPEPKGIMDLIPERNKVLNCAADIEAQPLTDEDAINSLHLYCADLMDEIDEMYDGEGVYTCCNVDQIKTLSVQLSWLNGIVGRCPACRNNLFNTFCYMVCHPEHSKFALPTSSTTKTTTQEEAIDALTYYMNDEEVTRIYQSCEEVYYPDLSISALAILCGSLGTDCDPHALFDYFGDNFMTPFPIAYEYTNETGMIGINYKDEEIIMEPYWVDEVYTCGFNASAEDQSQFCLCADCQDSCLPVEIDTVTTHDFDSDLMTLILLIIFCVLVALLVGGYIIRRCCMSSKKTQKSEKTNALNNQVGTPSFSEKWSAELDDLFTRFFTRIAAGVVRHPLLNIAASLALCGALCAGLSHLALTTDPVKLWASPSSRTRMEKEVFDTEFRPFYRTTQVILRAPPGMQEREFRYGRKTYTLGPIFNETLVIGLMELVNNISALTAEYEGKEVTMRDVCNRPLYPQSDACTMMTVTEYWQNDMDLLLQSIKNKEFEKTMIDCIRNPASIDPDQTYCLGASGVPVLPYTALGGFLPPGAQNSLTNAEDEYFTSTALLLTMPLDNYADKSKLGPVLAWEAVFLEFMKEFQEENKDRIDFAYNAERGIEDEIARSSMGDVRIIGISYLLMFVYITLALGTFSSSCNRMMLESKVVVGLTGVLLVLVAVFASMGLYGWAGVEATLFCIEVVPFLVLAVGVDNIFIIVQTYQREELLKGETTEDLVARVIGKAAPTLLVSTTSEAVCFFLGAMSDMPAVYSFCLYAGMALVINFLLQMTCFVAVLYFDARRVADQRYDIFCCVKGTKTESSSGLCYSFMRDVYSKLLLKSPIKIAVALLFTASLFVNACYIPNMDVGLEQDLSMPDDSFVKKYFSFLNLYMSIGAPVYLVVTDGYNWTDIDHQNAICSSSGCNIDSMLSQVYTASLETNLTLVASGSNSWIENYLSWITDTGGDVTDPVEACCRLDENDVFINSSKEVDRNTKKTCLDMATDTLLMQTRPKPEHFMEWVPYFLVDNPHETKCPVAGHPAFGDAVVVNTGAGGEPLSVGHSYFMAYHTILRTSKDFTDALEQIYKLTDQYTEYIQEKTGTKAEVFPYSIFYVYYEQYLTMWHSTLVTLLSSLAAVFVVLLLLTGFSVGSSLITLVTITMILVNMMGMMVWWNIQLNAVTLVNLVMAIGISVEFCSHIVHAFATSLLPSRNERAIEALATMGSSVFSGITLTKLVGISVLAAAQSPIFKIFYFRMYLGMVVFGGTHSLLLLPVLLSVAGPGVNKYLLKKDLLRKGKSNEVSLDRVST